MPHLTCPIHGVPLETKRGPYSTFKGCPTWRVTRCDIIATYSQWIDEWIISTKEERNARIATHEVFDEVWKSGQMSRREAYQKLSEDLNIRKNFCHIQHFNVEQCERVQEWALKQLKKGMKNEMETTSKYEFTEEMGEISGMGGGYEQCCRDMLKAGLEWLDAHPDADPKFHGFKGVYGIIDEDNEDAEALTKAIIDASGGGATGAMHQAVVSHCLVIRKEGWDHYVEKMSERKKAKEEKKANEQQDR